MLYVFGECTLDTQRYVLHRAGRVNRPRRKVLHMLAYLLAHANRVVSKQELCEQVWPQQSISESALKNTIKAVRQAIGDSGRGQRLVRTVYGQGYRFIGRIESPSAEAVHTRRAENTGDVVASDPLPPLSLPTAHVYGREAEFGHLYRCLQQVWDGKRQVVFVTGEAGVGKTTLVDAFVQGLPDPSTLRVGYGQCIDSCGAGEACLPVLEALGRLCRGPEGAAFLSVLRQYAPSWFGHLPTPPASEDRQRLPHTPMASGVTPARTLRELTEALEVLTATRPLVLVLEDLHWSDQATLEWLAYVVRRRDPARLLILGTYRPLDVIGQAHPLRRLLATLCYHPQCAELELNYLSAPAVAAYLQQRYGAQPVPTDLPQFVYQRTSGHPLFVVMLVDELLRQQSLAAGRGAWHNAYSAIGRDAWDNGPSADAGVWVIPKCLRQFIEAHVEQLCAEDQTVLAAASVAGHVFSVAAVAAGVSLSEETIDARCGAWARHGQFLHAAGTETWPDGTVTACYQFCHVLYQEVVYARVSAGQRLRLHQQIGLRKEAGYGAQAPTIAAELAGHFTRAQDACRAVKYLRLCLPE